MMACWWWFSQGGGAGKFIASSAPGPRIAVKERDMKNSNEFPFEKARRVTKKELAAARKAIEAKTGKPRPPRGRPAKA